MTQHLYALVIKLSANNGGTIPEAHGKMVHGAFFEIIRTIDPVLSSYLHEIEGAKPFTLSMLQGMRGKEGQPCRVRPGQSAWLRFTLHHQQLFSTFTQYILAPSVTGWPTIRVGSVDFTILEMLTTPQNNSDGFDRLNRRESSPAEGGWAGYDTVQTIQSRWQSRSDLPTKIRMEFASPTAFSPSSEEKKRFKKWIDPIPMPEFLFSSLMSKWRRCMGLAMQPSEVGAYARQTVVVSRCKLETKQYYLKRNVQIGSVGRMSYELKDTDNQEMTRLLNMLADLAFYSGVGHKTTQGMGMARRVN